MDGAFDDEPDAQLHWLRLQQEEALKAAQRKEGMMLDMALPFEALTPQQKLCHRCRLRCGGGNDRA